MSEKEPSIAELSKTATVRLVEMLECIKKTAELQTKTISKFEEKILTAHKQIQLMIARSKSMDMGGKHNIDWQKELTAVCKEMVK